MGKPRNSEVLRKIYTVQPTCPGGYCILSLSIRKSPATLSLIKINFNRVGCYGMLHVTGAVSNADMKL